MGSSFLPGELIAAFLFAQLQQAHEITKQRLRSWQYYHQLIEPLEAKGLLKRPVIPEHCEHNAHMYYVLITPEIDRQIVLDAMKCNNINAVFHYIPLHSSPAGMQYGRADGNLNITDQYSQRLIRLPLWIGLEHQDQDKVADVLIKSLLKF